VHRPTITRMIPIRAIIFICVSLFRLHINSTHKLRPASTMLQIPVPHTTTFNVELAAPAVPFS
jgi:hypothetical protein